MFTFLQTSAGNAYVQSVIGLLGGQQFSSAPVQLNPNAPAPSQRVPVLANAANLKAQADRATAQAMLKSEGVDAGEQAAKALELLLDVPPDHQGRVIDGLDDKSFQNLLERVPNDQRERFAALVEASQKPERKLMLWAEFHKSRAENDLGRHRGDVGKNIPTHKTTDDDGTSSTRRRSRTRTSGRPSRRPGPRSRRRIACETSAVRPRSTPPRTKSTSRPRG